MNKSALPPINVIRAAKNLERIPSPSAIAPELLRLIDDENMSTVEFTHLLARDHALVVRLLRVANSSFYGMSGRVSSITDALAILGMRTVRTLVLLSTFSELFARTTIPCFDIEIFWRHGLATAVGTRALARRMRWPEGSAFVAGLLHDIGYLVLAGAYPRHLTALLDLTESGCDDLPAAETTILGFDHTQLGAQLAQHWHFPAEICEGIADHHRRTQPDSGSLAWVVRLADTIAHMIGAPGIPSETLAPVTRETWESLGISAEDGEATITQIYNEFETLVELFINRSE